MTSIDKLVDINAGKVRRHVLDQYIRPAQVRGEQTVTITAGAIEPNPLWQLRGIAKGMFKPGEWEALIKRDRQLSV